MAAERIEVVGVQLEPAARQHERARHPGRLEPEDARSGVDGFLNCGAIQHAWRASSVRPRGVCVRDDTSAARSTARIAPPAAAHFTLKDGARRRDCT